MKKITFLAFLIAGAVQAQYCTMSPDILAVEAITSVKFDDEIILNSDSNSVLIDKISTVVYVSKQENYLLTVKGNTNGQYTNEFLAFIDWNHNDVLDDEGEVYYLGAITASTGLDAKATSTSINIPATALEGNTRIRIIKTYTDFDGDLILVQDPCSVSIFDEYFNEVVDSYGQALDFTINISTLNRDAFEKSAFLIYPNPTTDVLKFESNETIDSISIYNLQGQLVLEGKSTKEVNIQSLATGSYMVKITSGNLSQVKKFVKM